MSNIAELEKKVDYLLKEVERLQSVNDLQRLMGKYMTCHVRSNRDDVLSLKTSWRFFANRADSSAEIADHGVFIGIDNIRKMYEGIFAPGPTEGCMYEHNLATPQIVVAEDGQTARGLWQSPGHETDPRMSDDPNGIGKPVATWVWGRIAADFIKENGEWKIWHYHWYRLFRCPFDKSWVDYVPSAIQKGGAKNHPAFANLDIPERSRETTYHNVYGVNVELESVPPSPEPYATWTEDRELP
ncbi:MAG: hypothetical protein H6Q73_3743 [Firmicutes bacterium]|nr:hypothetical protein [Bacillota bacterium]